MLGLMQDWPLLVHKIIDHAALYHGDREVVSRSVEGPIVRTNYREVARRARKVADQDTLGHLEFEPARRKRGREQRRMNEGRQVTVPELDR